MVDLTSGLNLNSALTSLVQGTQKTNSATSGASSTVQDSKPKFWLPEMPSTTVPDSETEGKATNLSEPTDTIFKKSAIGSITEAISNSFRGINHRGTPSAIQLNKDYHGLTFFTRPEMNLTWDNLHDIRKLAPLLTDERNSIPRIIRCYLDRNLQNDVIRDGQGNAVSIESDLVDNQQAFIPLLTNHLISMSGWPDMVLPTMTSQPGMYQESFSMADGVTDIYSTYDIHANFRNIPGDPITLLFLAWCQYASYVYQGLMVPYSDKIINNEIDYQTRIYRLVLDSSKRFVKKIAACGAAFPVSSPIGASFNFEHDKPIIDANHQISIPFRCMGAIYQDDILINEFNDTVIMFNGGMGNDVRSSNYTKLPYAALQLFNNRGYPYINPDTYELEWWIKTDDFKQIQQSVGMYFGT